MQTFMDLVTNANLQAWIWGPLMGVLCGALFAGITNSPSGNAPVTVVQTKQTFVTNITNNHKATSGSGSDGAGAIFIALAFGLMFVVWKYAVYVELIHYYLWVSLSSVLGFAITTALVSLIKGQFTSGSWGVFIAAPVLILVGCGWIIGLAKSTIDPNLSTLASQNTFYDFYMRSLTDYGRSLMISHVLGMVITLVVMVFTGLALLHYLALMNQRSYGKLHRFWMLLTGVTMFFSGKAWLFFMICGLLLAYLLIEPGSIPLWMTQKSN